jgi:hypothetical protein
MPTTNNADMPEYFNLRIKTTGETRIVRCYNKKEMEQVIVAQQNELGEDLLGFEVIYPDGRKIVLAADGGKATSLKAYPANHLNTKNTR